MGKLIVDSNYGVTPNDVLNSTELTFAAKGMFGFLQSKPDGWRFSVSRMVAQTKEGKAAVQSALKELEEQGYLKRIPRKGKDGKWDGFDYVLHISPFTDFPSTVKPSTGKPPTVNRQPLVRKNDSKQDISKKEVDFAAVAAREVNQVIEAFKEINPHLNYGNKTERKAAQELIDAHGLVGVLKVIALLHDTNQEPYAPKITTPYKLNVKWADLGLFLQKKKKPKSVDISHLK